MAVAVSTSANLILNSWAHDADALAESVNDLSPREQQIIELVAADRTFKSIASELGIAPATVRQHLATARLKFRCKTSLRLMRLVTVAELLGLWSV